MLSLYIRVTIVFESLHGLIEKEISASVTRTQLQKRSHTIALVLIWFINITQTHKRSHSLTWIWKPVSYTNHSPDGSGVEKKSSVPYCITCAPARNKHYWSTQQQSGILLKGWRRPKWLMMKTYWMPCCTDSATSSRKCSSSRSAYQICLFVGCCLTP